MKETREVDSGGRGKTGTGALGLFWGDRRSLKQDLESFFLNTTGVHFTTYFQALVPWVDRWWKKLFPNGERWKKSNPGLCPEIKVIFRDAAKVAVYLQRGQPSEGRPIVS